MGTIVTSWCLYGGPGKELRGIAYSKVDILYTLTISCYK